MTLTLSTLIAACLSTHAASAGGVARSIVFRREDNEDHVLALPVELDTRQVADERGGLETMEMAVVLMSLAHWTAIDPAAAGQIRPARGDRLYVDGDPQAYLYVYQSQPNAFMARIVFERRQQLAGSQKSSREQR